MLRCPAARPGADRHRRVVGLRRRGRGRPGRRSAAGRRPGTARVVGRRGTCGSAAPRSSPRSGARRETDFALLTDCIEPTAVTASSSSARRSARRCAPTPGSSRRAVDRRPRHPRAESAEPSRGTEESRPDPLDVRSWPWPPRCMASSGTAGSSAGLRHPTMHPMQPLEARAGSVPRAARRSCSTSRRGELPRLTESVLGYVAAVSERTPVIYVALRRARGGGGRLARRHARARSAAQPLRPAAPAAAARDGRDRRRAPLARRARPVVREAGGARRAGGVGAGRYFNSRESRRSLRMRPPRLAVRAVGHHVVLEVDGFEDGLSYSAGTARRGARGRVWASGACPGSGWSTVLLVVLEDALLSLRESHHCRASASWMGEISSPRLKGDSWAACRMSSTHVRPMPAITCWSRRTECSGRAPDSARRSASRRPGRRLGPGLGTEGRRASHPP